MIDIKENLLSGYTFIDLFSGLGGFRLALESLGALCIYSSEIDEPVRKVYIQNFQDIPAGDITKVNEKDIPDHDILCAGFPCQAFSISGKQRGFEDSRGTLFFDVARITMEKQPQIVFMENVKNFITHDKGQTLGVVKRTMEELGYVFYYKLLDASLFGVPQKRERVYMVAFRKDLVLSPFSFPAPLPKDKIRTVSAVLLPEEEVEYLYEKHDDLILSIPQVSDKSKTIRVGVVGKGGQGERVYSIDGQGITLSAHGGGRFSKTGGYLVGERVRKLHPREAARLMGFPEWYVLDEKPNMAYKQLGNSVVVDVLQYIGVEIGKSLQGRKGS